MIRRIKNVRLRLKVQAGRSQMGLTLPELLLASVIMILAFAGILISYLRCLELSEISRNSSIAIQAVESRMERIRNTAFAQIKPTYHNVIFSVPAINGMGVSYVDDSNPQLLKVTVTYCWRQSNGRIVGEDTNLNGVLNNGEDRNGNGILDSLAQAVTYIYSG